MKPLRGQGGGEKGVRYPASKMKKKKVELFIFLGFVLFYVLVRMEVM